MRNSALHLILGDCLFPHHENLIGDGEACHITLIEDESLCTHYRYHKHKLVFFLTSMRKHATALKAQHVVHYYPLQLKQGLIDSRSFESKLSHCFEQNPLLNELRTYEVDDDFFAQRLEAWSRESGIPIRWVPSPKFLFSRADFKDYLASRKKPFLKTYYQRQREALGILIEPDGSPSGGSWSYDTENRKKLPKGSITPLPLTFIEDKTLREVKEMVEAHFAHHPGKVQNFNWATSRSEALQVLGQFIEEKLELFGPYEDAFEASEKFLFHSTLSPYLNNGLLIPQEVLSRVYEHYQEHQSHLPSVEGFIRQLIGWREFIRGMYLNFDFGGNYFELHGQLKPSWYEGNTGIPPLDDAIHKLNEEAYNHHIERLMILGNLMLLCEIHPQAVYTWFMEMYIDSADWVMVPNVLGMSQYADGGIFATKPYIAGSNYMRKMSHYPKGDWCDTVDGLYWRFIDKFHPTFKANPRMSMMVATLNKMDPERKKRIFAAAENFLDQHTQRG